MNVGLWAEIRRLAEVDQLSVRAIARRLRCARRTVTAALQLDHPSARQCNSRHCSVLLAARGKYQMPRRHNGLDSRL